MRVWSSVRRAVTRAKPRCAPCSEPSRDPSTLCAIGHTIPRFAGAGMPEPQRMSVGEHLGMT